MASGKAVVINAHGGIDKFEIVDSFAVRAPQAGELLLKNVAASVNPVDTYVRSGMYPASRFPTVWNLLEKNWHHSLHRQGLLSSCSGCWW